jgi:TrmH family RNA methyltransferase
VLVLDRVTEPGNVGTILRTAWAVGLSDVWVTTGTSDPLGPKAIRAGMGAQFSLDVHSVGDLAATRDSLRELGVGCLWAAEPEGGVSCFAAEFELAGNGIVIGNEASGVTPGVISRGVTIPMPGGAESLNAAQAATVLLCEAVRRGLLGSHERHRPCG